jgi:hypothetical protein
MSGCGKIFAERTERVYSQVTLGQNPVHYYALEETTGTTTRDQGSSPINLNLSTPASIQRSLSGRVGGAYSFSGVGHLIPASALTMSANWTITFWAQTPLLLNNVWKSVARGTLTHLVMFNLSTGEYGAYTNSLFRPSGIFPNNLSQGWHHFATVGSAAQLDFYIDGDYASTITPGTVETITSIGGNAFTQPCSGLDEIAIFNRALTPQEIQEQAVSL